jgi:hypothetical protein
VDAAVSAADAWGNTVAHFGAFDRLKSLDMNESDKYEVYD